MPQIEKKKKVMYMGGGEGDPTVLEGTEEGNIC